MKNFRCIVARSFPLIICVFLASLFCASQSFAKDIRVSGFSKPRNPMPLVGYVPTDEQDFDPSESIRNALLNQTNFGTEGYIQCPVKLQQFVPSIAAGSLVTGTKRNTDVFFGGASNQQLTVSESNELVSFINKGGIVYLSSLPSSNRYGGWQGYHGENFNPLFSSLNISDTFPQNEVVDFVFCGTSSTPALTPVTNGPFGKIGPLHHFFFNPINTNSLQSVATGFTNICFIGMLAASDNTEQQSITSNQFDRTILAEGKFGKGYLSVSGEPLYTSASSDQNNMNYFLNLFSLACTNEDEEISVEPFLDLPWDYSREGTDLIFRDAALSLNAYFDHEYPLLSTGLGEPESERTTVTIYKGDKGRFDYSSHDGYDWGKVAGAGLGADVLAAAPGCATYSYNKASGNAILIDHGNNYQTRYYHLLDNGLITKSTSSCTQVTRGQKIGLVGSTGNSTGAHIHFMVVEDKDRDNSFDDNIPDGITDPFGWSGDDPDPWQSYTFQYRDEDLDGKLDHRVGNKSNYLWLGDINGFSGLFSKGEINEIIAGRYQYRFFENTFPTDVQVEEKAGANVQASDTLFSIGSISILGAKESNGNLIETLLRPFSLTIDFGNFDLTGYKEDSLSIYSSQDGKNWTKESTILDFANKKATSQINHLSEFALMGEKKDSIAPKTEALFTGLVGEDNWYRSDVEISLLASDNEDGLGLDYTLYRTNDGDWQEYNQKLLFSNEGVYTIDFYSVDSSENIEEVKTRTFSIDKTPPEANIKFDLPSSQFKFTNKPELKVVATHKKGNEPDTIILIDKAGNKLSIVGKLLDRTKANILTIESLQYNLEPKVVPTKNSFFVLHKDKLPIELTQRITFKNEDRITIIYNNRLNQSTIVDKSPKPFTEEKRPGIVFLLLTTKNGTLEVDYE